MRVLQEPPLAARSKFLHLSGDRREARRHGRLQCLEFGGPGGLGGQISDL
jgi:hypothetical protein